MPFGNSQGVDLIFGLALVGTVFVLLRRWRALWDAEFTAADRQLATQAAVFVVPAVVVLVHELGHLVAAKLVGGRVLGFHYGFIEGSVAIAGGLTPAQEWWVALAGNLAGGLTGLAMAWAGTAGVRLPRALRHLLVMGGLLEVGFHLVIYPLLSLSARFGDWEVIYDFGATPGLSALTVAAHVVAAVAVWRWWRGGVRRTLFKIDHGLEADVDRLERAVAATSQDPEPAIELAVLYAQNQDMSLARETLDSASGRIGSGGPGAARLHLVRARLAAIEDRWNQAYMAAQAGLGAAGGGNGDDEVTQRLWANVGLALASMHRPEQAVAAFEHLRRPVADDPRVLYARGLARMAAGDRAGGEDDLRAVSAWRPEGDLLRQWAEARLQGREPPPPDDRDRPNYARRTKAPPAPIAGV